MRRLLPVLAAVAAPALAVPPPTEQVSQTLVLPDTQCRISATGTVRAYSAAQFTLPIKAPTVLRILPGNEEPDLYVDIERADGSLLLGGAGLSSGDLRIALPAGQYRLRIGMRAEAARSGRQIDFKLMLQHGLESAAPACPQ